MTQSVQTGRGSSRRPVDKFDERRAQLAASALVTLSELGYARTSLREIAQNSEFSHGVLHYYFQDKNELILYCVRQYKTECVHRYDDIVVDSAGPAELCRGFGSAMATTLLDDGRMHRLWYDMRSQALFLDQFRQDVIELDGKLEQMIWRIVTRYAELAGGIVTVTPAVAYALFDGLFQQALLRHLAGDLDAATRLRLQVEQLLPTLTESR